MKKIRLLIKKVGAPCIEATIHGDILKELQGIVGGYIDAYQLSPRDIRFPIDICCVCNEDGLALELKENVYDFVGDIAILKVGGEDFESLTQEEIEICKTILNEADVDKPQLFELGECVATRIASQILDNEKMFSLLKRHSTGDFGDLCDEDKATNIMAIRYGDRVLSRYEIADEIFYVITEADRSYTTVMLADEY